MQYALADGDIFGVKLKTFWIIEDRGGDGAGFILFHETNFSTFAINTSGLSGLSQ